jgi:hypothetical protein
MPGASPCGGRGSSEVRYRSRAHGTPCGALHLPGATATRRADYTLPTPHHGAGQAAAFSGRLIIRAAPYFQHMQRTLGNGYGKRPSRWRRHAGTRRTKQGIASKTTRQRFHGQAPLHRIQPRVLQPANHGGIRQRIAGNHVGHNALAPPGQALQQIRIV